MMPRRLRWCLRARLVQAATAYPASRPVYHARPWACSHLSFFILCFLYTGTWVAITEVGRDVAQVTFCLACASKRTGRGAFQVDFAWSHATCLRTVLHCSSPYKDPSVGYREPHGCVRCFTWVAGAHVAVIGVQLPL